MYSSYLYINFMDVSMETLAGEVGQYPWGIYMEEGRDGLMVFVSAEKMAHEKGYNKAASMLAGEDIYGAVIIIGLGGRNGKEWCDVSPRVVKRLKEICKKVRWEEYYHGDRKRAPV